MSAPSTIADQRQSWVLSRLAQMCAQGPVEPPARPCPEARPYPPPGFKDPRRHRGIGLLGPRGAGKSHTLLGVWDRWKAAPPKGVGRWCFLPPLDCTLAEGPYPFALAILEGLSERLRGDEGKAGRTAPDPCRCSNQSSDQRVDDRLLDEIRSILVRTGSDAAAVAQRTASSLRDFGERTAELAGLRQRLPQLIQRWLDGEAARLQVAGFILPLDDLDLARGAREALVSLLDELHQERLIFIVVADPVRLDELFIAHTGLGRAQLHKAIPASLRLHLNPLPIPERRRLLMDRAADDGRSPPPLGPIPWDNAIQREPKDPPLPAWKREHLDALLPPYPRGVADVREALTVPRNLLELLALLAEARGESLLSRHLRHRDLNELPLRLRLPDLRGGGWTDLARRARQPYTGLRDLLEAPGGEAVALTLPLDSDLLDAPDPRWPELLLDLAAERGIFDIHSDREGSALAARMDRASARLTLSADAWVFTFERPSTARLAATWWLEGAVAGAEQREDVVTTLGWAPFSRYLRRRREPWSSALVGALLVSDASLGELLRAEGRRLDEVQAALIPSRVRPCILLTQGLESRAWLEVSANAPSSRELTYYARIAAAFTLAALLDASTLTPDSLRALIEISSPTGVGALLAKDDKEMEQWFNGLPTVLPEPKEEAELSAAAFDLYESARQLLRHPAWTALRAG